MAALAACWHSLATASDGRGGFPVTPATVATALAEGLGDGTLLRGLAASLGRVALAFSFSIVVGSALGGLMAAKRLAAILFGPIVVGIQSLPSICWLPVAVLWFGLNERAILFVATMGSLPSIVVATRDGLLQIPLPYQRVASTFGATPWQRMLLVQVPAAVPSFLAGLKQGWSFAWRSLLAGELLYRSTSAGSLLTDARDLADYPRLFAVILLLMMVSVIVDRALFGTLEAKVRRLWELAPR